MHDTSTKEGQEKRIAELVREKTAKGDKTGLVRLVGGSVDDWGDYTPSDAGNAPQGSNW